jgi:ribosomal protein L25 (general stress protein Ctc)
MTSTRPALAAEHRTVTGKAVARLRRDGRLPAVVYGHGIESAPVTLSCAATSARTP